MIVKDVTIGDRVWIATDTFVAPGVTISSNVVVGARSTVFANLNSGFIYAGYPAKPVKTLARQGDSVREKSL